MRSGDIIANVEIKPYLLSSLSDMDEPSWQWVLSLKRADKHSVSLLSVLCWCKFMIRPLTQP